MDREIVLFVLALAVLMPIGGLTLRLTLKPMVDAIARLMELRAASGSSEILEKRVTLLEQEMQYLRAENNRLQDEREFFTQLESPNRH